ncbi:MAG: polysaccharide biosynthesis/export family protein [Bryobacterales bacterium]|nr:polysaccharide biosynthesis/export family protein [Bryobacterales bacterium]MBV9401756.1 polysaccharide biosynthesis/export family protein [Bryobacterales bacterium]
MKSTTMHVRTLVSIFVALAAAQFPTAIASGADIPKDSSSKADGVRAGYVLGPEDVIDVFVWKEPELTTTGITIRPDGRISLPLTGEIDASGRTAERLQEEISDRLKRYIADPVVNVMVKQINSLKISVLGEVRKPDVYHIKNRVTVLDAIAMAGGFTDLARPKHVIVLRNSSNGPQRRIKVNINDLVSDSGAAPFYLEPLDTVYVEGR